MIKHIFLGDLFGALSSRIKIKNEVAIELKNSIFFLKKKEGIFV